MSADIYVVPDALSSRLLKPVQGHLNDAKNALTRLNTCPTYYGPDGYSSLYPSSVYTEANRLAARIRAIENKINRYASILNSAPEELSRTDSAYKGRTSTWKERTAYGAVEVFSDAKTIFGNSVAYWVDSYKEKGWVYKTVQTAIVIGKAAPAVIGCAATWAATPFAPTTLLSTAYAANEVANAVYNISHIWNNEFDKVGQTNFLKDSMENGCGDLTEKFFDNREVGELIGNGIYAVGDIVVGITNARATTKVIKKRTLTSTAEDDLGRAVQSKVVVGKDTALDLRGQVIQNDVSFKTVKDAIKEVPDAIAGYYDILVHSPLSRVKLDSALLAQQITNIMKVKGAVELLDKVADKTADITHTIIDLGLDVIELVK